MDGKFSNEEWLCCLYLECIGDICEYCFINDIRNICY